MKKRICLLFIVFIFLTGCAQQDDFIGSAVHNTDVKLGSYNEMPKDIETDMMVVGVKSFEDIYNAFNTTFLADYIEMDERTFDIDMNSYLGDYIAENNLKSASMPKEDYVKLVSGNQESWKEYQIVIDNDLVYIVNSDKVVMEECSLMLFSKNTEVKEALISAGYENLYKMFEIYDAEILSDIESSKMPFCTSSALCCEIVVNFYGTHFYENATRVPAATKYLTELYQNDSWMIQHGGVNDVCESISLLYTDDDYTIDENDEFDYVNIRMDLYGKDGELKEVKLTYESVLNVIPETCRFTLTECLTKLGCNEAEINSFFDKIPQKSGNIGKLHFITDEVNRDNKVIKLYVK